MKSAILLLLPVCLFAAGFENDWRFLKADAPGAEQAGFADSAWRTVSVPHDWAIEGPFDARNPTGQAGGFLPAGIGWYRKHIALTAAEAARHVFVDFDGVMGNSDVWINGFHLGKRPYGYVSFRYELTGHLHPGDNVLAVRADNSLQPASRWYAGAGIYRHVRLVSKDAVHLEHWGTFVTTPNTKTVRVESAVVNQSDAPRSVALAIAIAGPDGTTVKTVETAAQTVGAGKSADFAQDIAIAAPQLWSLEHPALYRAVVKVRASKTVLDEETVTFGIREFHFDPATGFWLNGKNFKIKGECLHADGGAFGTAVPIRVWERRLEVLRQLGVNAIRTAHNPPAPEFLDLCDRMGFLVMDEMFDCWTVAKNPYDYHLAFREWSKIDTRDTVRRDRNHPSIILYSAGNEIHDTPKADLAKEILKGLVDVFHENDATRPVTQALFRPNASHDYDNGLADLLDVVGQNYRENEILAANAAKPTRKIVGTENQHGREVWVALRDHAPYSGQFIWAGIDYLGEAHQWPAVFSAQGDLDHTGGIKPMGYQRMSWWSEKPMVRIARRVAPAQAAPTDPGYEANPRRGPLTLLSDWTPANLAAHEENVEVYSNCQEVELLLNGKSLGAKPLSADASPRNWRVPFEAGTLKAIGRNQGQMAAEHELRTAGKPARLVLAADRARLADNWDDVAYVTATIVDENGVVVPGAENLVSFAVAGPGAVAATDNADIANHESFQSPERYAFQGQCQAIVRAAAAQGSITVTASAAGLKPATVRIEVRR
jgi:beta-galactosidase